eukprot:m.1313060 g.1313060  ORF g.1313060 m.1313060 type:complete len:1076 (+) comp24832_c0_seq3:173-3400(+)
MAAKGGENLPDEVTQQASDAKEVGNGFHKEGKYKEAVEAYSKGLSYLPPGHEACANFHKNLAASYLKLKEWKKVILQCDKALEITPADVKALFRRAQAYDNDGDPEKAFSDITKVVKLDPKNKAAQALAHKLMTAVSSKQKYKRSTAGIGNDIVDKAIKGESPAARLQSCKNIAAFAQDEAGAENLFSGGVARLMPLLENVEDVEVVTPILHALASVASNSVRRAVGLLAVLSSDKAAEAKLMALIQHRTPKVVKAAVMVISQMLESVSVDSATGTSEKVVMNKMLDILIALIPHRGIIAEARDAAIAGIVKNVKRSDVGKRFVDRGGITALLITASCAPSPVGIKAPNADGGDADGQPSVGIAVSAGTRMQVSVALSHTWEATMVQEKGKPPAGYPRMKDECIKSIRWASDPLTNLPAMSTLIAIIQGITPLGNEILDSPGVMQKLIAMAQCDHHEVQCAAAEALAHAASDNKRSKGVMTEGFGILKRLYAKDLPDAIRVRALAGLCKMGSHGGAAANKKAFADGATVNLAKKIRHFLIDESMDLDCRKWASEGLAYLTLDADVKEMIVGDKKVLKVIKNLCLDGDPTVQFGLANLLVNVTNSYDKQEDKDISEQEEEALKKIGKFAGEHIPEPHKLDDEKYVEKRVEILIKSGITESLVSLAKSTSDRAREQVARVFLALVATQENRGVIIQQGGAKALIPLANDNTDKGKLKAAQALAKMAITTDPNIAFPGQRAAELVRPLLGLTKSRKGLHQFEACMALTNLASVSEDLRMRVVREDGIKALEDLMFDDDWMVRRSATETLCNMMYCEKVFEMFATKEGKCWERLKLWILLSGAADEDFETARAAAGGLALLSASPEVCTRITTEKQGLLILKENAASGNMDMQMRALHTLLNMVQASKEIAEKIVDEQGLELLSALHLTLPEGPLKNYVSQILDELVTHGIIQHVKDAHKKGMAMATAAQTVESFKKKEEEEDEDEEDDDDAAAGEEEDGDSDEDVDFSWPRHPAPGGYSGVLALPPSGLPRCSVYGWCIAGSTMPLSRIACMWTAAGCTDGPLRSVLCITIARLLCNG